MLVFLAAPLVLLFGIVHANDSSPTDVSTHFNWLPCNPNDTIKYNNLTFQDAEGKDIYPIKISQPFVVNVQIDNTNGPWNDLRVDAKLRLWLGAEWMELPIAGFFEKLFVNDGGIKLPVESGMQNLKFTIDLTPLAPFTSFLPSTGHYRIELQFREEKSARNSCLVVETLVSTA